MPEFQVSPKGAEPVRLQMGLMTDVDCKPDSDRIAVLEQVFSPWPQSGRSEMKGATVRLAGIKQGDSDAAEQLLALVYDELRRFAASKLAHEVAGQTLQATALVHEAWMRLVGNQTPFFEDPTHSTLKNDWAFSRAWLLNEMEAERAWL